MGSLRTAWLSTKSTTRVARNREAPKINPVGRTLTLKVTVVRVPVTMQMAAIMPSEADNEGKKNKDE
jgi:hypothetical protein